MVIPSLSKKQQRLFGMVHRCQKSGHCANDQIKDMAGKIKEKDVEGFASTKHKGLPDKVKRFKSFKEFQEDKENNIADTALRIKVEEQVQLPWAAQRVIDMSANTSDLDREQKLYTFSSVVSGMKPDFYDMTQFIARLRQMQSTMNPSQEVQNGLN